MQRLREDLESWGKYVRINPLVGMFGGIALSLLGGLTGRPIWLLCGVLFLVLWYGRWFWIALPLLLFWHWGALHRLAPWWNYEGQLCFPSCHVQMTGHVKEWRGERALFRIASMEGPYGWRNVDGIVLVEFRGEFPEEGRHLYLEGAIFPLEGEKAYLRQMRVLGVRHRVIVQRTRDMGEGMGLWSLCRWRGRMRRWLTERLTEGMEDAELAGVTRAMLLGDRSGVSREAREMFQRSGSVHIFSVSGMHVTLLALSLACLAGCLGLSVRWRKAIVLPLLAVYVFVTGGAPSALRAWWMVAGSVFACLCYREYCPENSLALAGILLIIWEPPILLHSGFQFSFLLVFILLRGARMMREVPLTFSERERWLPRKQRRRILPRCVRLFWGTLCVATVAWLGSAGLTLSLQGMLCLGGLPVNLCVPFLAETLIICAIPKLLCSSVFPAGCAVCNWIMVRVVRILLRLAQWGGGDLLCLQERLFPFALCIVYYATLFLLLSRIRPLWIRTIAALLLAGILTTTAFQIPPPRFLRYNAHDGKESTAILLWKGKKTFIQKGSRRGQIYLEKHMKE